ncbi:hypothetical protein N7E81_10750 [Reichenbachiella carrageenanivorans]|uniref:PKD domain-containing protein n=1 Tax=Reichenbachiella carrageenanivorans TaxID=2979869 RepID=A0ABY6CVB1_9BACT|nr:hypothetical protein [Reichenbachiella carrageenanivorans]UXX77846.1 hypothetical protein N7E81_10750 [Reichenbachiella carrageenanivorans]
MKNILKNIMAATLLIWVVSACDDEYEAPNAGAKHSVVYSAEQSTGNQVQVYGTISFGDASAGILSREWSVEEGVGYIISDDSASTSDMSNIKVIFTEGGTQEVKLHQEFDGDFYVGTNVLNSSYDTIISVTVLDYIKASIKANLLNDDGSLGAELTLSNGAKNQVTASKSVRFTYVSEGGPQQLDWAFDGGTPATVTYTSAQIVDGTADNTDVQYKRMGTYGVQFIASRPRPFGADTVSFTDFIEVIGSTEPVTLDAVTEADDVIALDFSREMDASTIVTTDFSVVIVNGATTINPVVASAALDPDQGNVILVTLEDEMLYNSDDVTVTYTPGALSTLDGVAASAFSEKVDFGASNVLALGGGMETGNWSQVNWNGPAITTQVAEIVTDFSRTGDASLHFKAADGQFAEAINNTDAFAAIEDGKTYRLSYWIYVTSATGTGANNQVGLFLPNNWADQAQTAPYTVTMNQWVYVSLEFSGKSTSTYMYARVLDGAELWVDDIELVAIEARP